MTPAPSVKLVDGNWIPFQVACLIANQRIDMRNQGLEEIFDALVQQEAEEAF
jgi:hypothetical protein